MHWTWLQISVDLWSSPELTIFGTVLNDNHRRLFFFFLGFACYTAEIVGRLLCVAHSSSQVSKVAKALPTFRLFFNYFVGLLRKARKILRKHVEKIISETKRN